MNRRQRRSAAAAAQNSPSSNATLTSASDIPLSHPDRSKPNGGSQTKAKTLYEIVAERQAQLAPHGTPFPKALASSSDDDKTNIKLVTISSDGSIVTKPDAEDDADAEPDNPIFDTIFLSFPLSFLHFTLSILTVHQYAQELRFSPIILNTVFVAFPTLTLLIHLFHGHLLPFPASTSSSNSSSTVSKAVKLFKQIMLLITANVAGCYLVFVTNDKGYYAVMKKAPSIGTVWVWTVLEMGLNGALAGVLGPGMYAWWNGYGIF